MAAPVISAKAYNFALTQIGTFEAVVAPTHHGGVRNGVGVSTITLLNTAVNRALLGNSNLYLIHVYYTSPAGNSRALAQVVFSSADVKEQINMRGDRIEITGPDLMIEWQKRRLHDAVISFGYGDPRVGDAPLTTATLSETACHITNPTNGSVAAQHFERWIVEVDNTTGGKTQAQINASSAAGVDETVILTFDTNYFGDGTRWSNGLPATGTGKDASLYSYEVTDQDFDQLLYFSELDDDGWSIVGSPGGSSISGTGDGTYSSAYGDYALDRLRFMALQDGGTFYMPLDTPTREIVYGTSAPSSGVTLSNSGVTGSNRGHIVGGTYRRPHATRYTRMQIIGPGAGVGALRLAAGRAAIEALGVYPDVEIAVDWQNSVLYAASWESNGRHDSPPIQFRELRALNDYEDSYSDAAVELYRAGLQRLRSQSPGYEYAQLSAYVLGYDLYPYHAVSVDYSDRGLSGTWYVDRIRRSLKNDGIILCDITLVDDAEAAVLLTPQEKIVNFSRAQWDLPQAIDAYGTPSGFTQ